MLSAFCFSKESVGQESEKQFRCYIVGDKERVSLLWLRKMRHLLRMSMQVDSIGTEYLYPDHMKYKSALDEVDKALSGFSLR